MARRLVLALVLILAVAAPASGTGIHDRKRAVDQRIVRLHEKITRAHEQEGVLTSQISVVTAKIRGLEGRVGQVSGQLDVLQRDLSLHQEKLGQLTELYRLETRRYTFLRRQYAASVQRLERRLVEIYESDSPDTIAVLLSSASVADLLDQLDYLNRIGSQDKRIAAEVAQAKAEVRAARVRTRQTRLGVVVEARAIAVRADETRSLRNRLLASKRDLAAARQQKQQTLASVQESEQQFVGEADALAQVSAQLAERIREAQAAAAKAAAERAAAERAAAERAAAERAAAERAAAEKAAAKDAGTASNSDVPPGTQPGSTGSTTTDSSGAPGSTGSTTTDSSGSTTTPSSTGSSPAPQAPSSGSFRWPVQGPIVSPFGPRYGRIHEGIDIAAATGTPIQASAAGTVIYAGWMEGYGNLVVIDHGNGLATAYAHQSQVAASEGQQVAQGDVIGYIGCTGRCFGPHLHFEVRLDGVPIDPLRYL